MSKIEYSPEINELKLAAAFLSENPSERKADLRTTYLSKSVARILGIRDVTPKFVQQRY